MDPLALDVLLARAQFGLNISFHILFPTLTIALAWLLFGFRLAWVTTRREHWLTAYRFWTKVFALAFALGVVSGITMSFQFGTNWPGFMETVGNIAGPLLGYEVLTAFFLEATFLGVMLFGHGRVSERMHLLATALVAFGTSMSAFWILALNSWMQTPAGFEMIDGVAHVTDWVAVIFNPSFPYRFAHMMLASLLTALFMMAGLSAWQILRRKENISTRPVFRTAVALATIAVPLQIFMGDLHGLNTLQHQPAKVAAMEGLWETKSGAPLVLFGIPSAEEKRNLYAIEIPHGASLILTHRLDGELKGIDAFPDAAPPVAPVFFGFRIMVGLGTLMLVLAWLGAYQLYRQRRSPLAALRIPKPLLWGFAGMTFSGWVATLAGWYVTEIGRQPYLVSGVLKTADAVSMVPPGNVIFSLVAYGTVYGLLLVAFIMTLRHLAEKPVTAPSLPESATAGSRRSGAAAASSAPAGT